MSLFDRKIPSPCSLIFDAGLNQFPTLSLKLKFSNATRQRSHWRSLMTVGAALQHRSDNHLVFR
jgi:hypothetical protein